MADKERNGVSQLLRFKGANEQGCLGAEGQGEKGMESETALAISETHKTRSKGILENGDGVANLPAGIAWKPRNLHAKGRAPRARSGVTFRSGKGVAAMARSASKLNRQSLSLERRAICRRARSECQYMAAFELRVSGWETYEKLR